VIALEVIEDCSTLRNFQAEWLEFIRRMPSATPFQRPEWLLTWWSHFGSGALRVMVFRRDGEVAGVLPCFLHHWNGRRQMTLVGSGVSDCLDPLFEPEYVDEIVARLRAHLRSRADWDICEWQDLSQNTPLAALGTVLEDTPCTVIAIEQPFEAFLAARPQALRRNLRRDKRKAEVIACVEFEVTESASEELMDALVRLHGARWAKAGEAGMIEANRSEAFLRDVSGRFGAEGWLKIFALRFANEIVAIVLAFCDHTTIYGYLTGFDPQYEDLSFGRELLAQALRYAHERGYRQWDFLRGEEPYKFLWGAQVIPKCRVVILPWQ
jgi:CelD/BcsL family acetyltransferase involved in cellulose biosynthesis